MLVVTFTLNGELNQMMFLFLVFFLFLSFVSSPFFIEWCFYFFSSMVMVCYDGFSLGLFLFHVFFLNFCLRLFSLSAAYYGFAALVTISTLAELLERRNITPSSSACVVFRGFKVRSSIIIYKYSYKIIRHLH